MVDFQLTVLFYGSVAGLATLLGIFLMRNRQEWAIKRSQYVNSFAAGLILSLVFFHLLPEANELSDKIDITNLAEGFEDFTDTAAVIENMDLVISVDTAVAHLAGAMGKPVWVLLGFAPDWRWMLERTDSPWYPTMRLFRQKEQGNWRAVFQRVSEELQIAIGRQNIVACRD